MKTTIALRLDPETREKLDLLSEATGYAPATLVSEAVRRFVDLELAAMLAARNEREDEEKPPLPERWNLIV